MIHSYRYNIMQLNTPETFIGVRGGLHGDTRDVYFVRALGTASDYAGRIEAIDRRMDADAASGRTRYIRIKDLPSITNATASLAEFAAMYDRWKSDKSTALFSAVTDSKSFEEYSKEALVFVTELFRSLSSSRSDSIVRNFAAKLLFWTSEILSKKNIPAWNEQSNIKIILEGIKKEQEYLFCYFLTRIGADVMILLPESDLEISQSLKDLSLAITIGPMGPVELRPYTPAAAAPSAKKAANTETPAAAAVNNAADKEIPAVRDASHPPMVHIPRREDRHKKESVPAATSANVHTVSNINAGANRGAGINAGANRGVNVNSGADTGSKREKSFEELARLASSIVMIAVHDKSGEVEGTGSGIMLGKGGYIITNFHVIRGGTFFSVRIEDDDTIYETNEVIKYNSSYDLAVIRIDHQLQPLPIYSGPGLVRGQKVVAIGSPLGMFNSVSDGIISGFRKFKTMEMIQFTAPTSPGSSGGALLNMQGEVIGISTAGIDSGQNINLAVPYDIIRLVAGNFI